MKETIAIIAALLAIVGNLPYLWNIIKGTTRPHPYTWLVGSVVSCVIFFGQLQAGAGIGALPTAAAEIFTIIIFLFSLKYGFKGITRSDTIFLMVALLAIVPWVLTRDPTISVILVVGIDLVSFIPTLRKSWNVPTSETRLLYSMNVVRHILALMSLEAYNIATTLHSIAMIILNTVMFLILSRSPKSKRRV